MPSPFARTRVALLAAPALALTAPIQGCVFADIERQLVRANDTLIRVETALEEVQRTNQRLVELQAQLRRPDTIDGSLSSVDGSLADVDRELDDIETSPTALDEHMASLRGTITSIDLAIPFLTVSSPTGEGGEAAEGAEADAGGVDEGRTLTHAESGDAGDAPDAQPAAGEGGS